MDSHTTLLHRIASGALAVAILVVGVVSVWPLLASAQANPEINYQGKLTDSSGSTVANGSYNMRFYLYNTTGGATTTAIWTEELTGADQVTVTSGLFSVMLGSTTPLSGVDFDQPLYLGVEIGGTGSPSWDGEMTPRKVLGTVPAAFQAQQANNAAALGGVASSSFLRSDAADTMAATTTSSLLTITQNGSGNILDLLSGSDSVFSALSNGNVGIGTNAPNATLDVNGFLSSGVISNPAAIISDDINGIAGMEMRNINEGSSAEFRFSVSDTEGEYMAFSMPSINNNSTIFGRTRSNLANILIAGDSGTPRNLGLGTFTSGDVLLATDNTERVTVKGDTGNVGIGINTPSSKLTVAGDAYITGALRDSTNSAGTNGYVLQTTGSGTEWVATSTLGIGGGASTFLGLSDTPSSFTAGRIPFTNSAGDALTDAANFTFDGSNLNLGGTNTGLAFQGTRMFYASTTNDSIAIGEGAGALFNASTTYNVALGLEAGQNASTTNSIYNNYIGYQAGQNNDNGLNNFIGYQAGQNNTGFYNNILGSTAGADNTGDYSNLLGTSAGGDNTGDNVNVFGRQAGQFNSGDDNNLFGYQAGQQNSGGDIVAMGNRAGLSNTGSYNNLIGRFAGRDNEGSYVNAIGRNAGYYNTGWDNNFIGYQAGIYSTGSSTNVLGRNAAFENTGSYLNVFGHSAGANNTGSYSEFIGFEAAAIMSASNTVAIGRESLRGGSGSLSSNAATTTNNTALGAFAGYNAQTGADNNLLLGYRAGYGLTTGANNIVIGYDVEAPSNTASNQLNIGNLLFGNGIDGTGTTTSSGNIGVGTSSPNAKLDVWGDMVVGTSSLVHALVVDSGRSRVGINTTNVDEPHSLQVDGSVYNTGGYNTSMSAVDDRLLSLTKSIFASSDITDNTVNIIDSRYAINSLEVASSSFYFNRSMGQFGGSVDVTAAMMEIVDECDDFFDACNTSSADVLRINQTFSANSGSVLNLTSASTNGGSILRVNDDGTYSDSSPFLIDAGGNVGIGTTSPSSKLTVVGDAYITGVLRDSTNSAGTNGYVLQTTGAGTQWVATSTLGIGGGGASTFLGLSDTPSSFTANRIPFTNAAGDALTDAANFTFDGNNLNLGGTNTGLAFQGTRMFYASTTNDSIAIGEGAGSNFNADTTYNVAIGFQAGENASSSFTDYNVHIGYEAGRNSDGSNSVFMGRQAGFNDGGGYDNVAIGNFAGQNLQGGYDNVAIGNGAGQNLQGGYKNVFLGDYAGADIIYEYQSNFIGRMAGRYSDGGNNNFLGPYAGLNNIGYDNNFLGSSAGRNNTGWNNNFLGRDAGRNNTGSYSEFIGYEAARRMSASNTIAIGRESLRGGSGTGGNAATTTNNTALGAFAGYSAQTGADNNLLLGYRAGYGLTTGANNIVIGYDVEAPSNTASNQLNIGNLLFGTGIDGTGTSLSSGNIGIGTSSPSSKLDVWGDFRVGTSSVPTLIANTATGRVGIGTSSPQSLLSLQAQDTADLINAYNTSGNSTFRVRENGQVNIGVSNDSYADPLLHISRRQVNSANYAGGSDLIIEDYGNPAKLAFMSDSQAAIVFGDQAGDGERGAIRYKHGDEYMSFDTNSTERMRITGSGLGVGTSTPSSKLDVWGDFRVGTSSTPNIFADASTGYTAFGTTTSNFTFDFNYATAGTGSDGRFRISDGGDGSNFVIDENGKVGIGLGSLKPTGIASNAANTLVIGRTNRAVEGMTILSGSRGAIYFGDVETTGGGSSRGQIEYDHSDDSLWFGTAANERLRIDQNGDIGIGTSTPSSRLTLENHTLDGAGVSGLNLDLITTNSADGAVQFGNQFNLLADNTATTTLVGSIYRLEDNTSFGNTVRGLEVQTNQGSNTQGENTAISGFGRTFGVRGVTTADAGGSFEPAGGYFETEGTTQGNAIRGYSSSITSASLLSLFQDTSAFTGTGLQMNFGNSGGSFSSTTASNFIDLQNAGSSRFTVGAYGMLTIGDGSTVNNAGIQIGYGGLCVDNDGECNASTTGRIAAVDYYTGNSDLAEIYFSSQALEPGEIVYTQGELSVGRASTETADRILGIVSTKPGLLLGSDDTSLTPGQTEYPIALSGRVPLKLSTENGPIEVGDQLMLSSIPGVAMKATSTGRVVGVALEDFDGSRAYSDTYVNQFGDDIAPPVYEPVRTADDPRIDDGCYYGGGTAAGEADCTPLQATTSDAQVREAEALAEAEAQEAALGRLRQQAAETVSLPDGGNAQVGQIVVFVENENRYLSAEGEEMIAALLASEVSTTSLAIGAESTLWQRLVDLASRFVDGVLSIVTLQADRVETDELCIDGVCVTGDELRALLDEQGASASGATNDNENTDTDAEGETTSTNDDADSSTATEDTTDTSTDNDTSSTSDTAATTSDDGTESATTSATSSVTSTAGDATDDSVTETTTTDATTTEEATSTDTTTTETTSDNGTDTTNTAEATSTDEVTVDTETADESGDATYSDDTTATETEPTAAVTEEETEGAEGDTNDVHTNDSEGETATTSTTD